MTNLTNASHLQGILRERRAWLAKLASEARYPSVARLYTQGSDMAGDAVERFKDSERGLNAAIVAVEHIQRAAASTRSVEEYADHVR